MGRVSCPYIHRPVCHRALEVRNHRGKLSNMSRSVLGDCVTDGAHWYLIQCRPRQDERALQHLERQAFECYLPVRPVERWRNGRKCKVPAPLFPRYLFIRLDSVNDNWYPILSTRGVNRIVRFNERPLPVRDDIIEGIRARLADRVEEPYLKPGERVQIMEGAFSQLEAIF